MVDRTYHHGYRLHACRHLSGLDLNRFPGPLILSKEAHINALLNEKGIANDKDPQRTPLDPSAE